MEDFVVENQTRSQSVLQVVGNQHTSVGRVTMNIPFIGN